jgi:hypothetical protein
LAPFAAVLVLVSAVPLSTETPFVETG